MVGFLAWLITGCEVTTRTERVPSPLPASGQAVSSLAAPSSVRNPSVGFQRLLDAVVRIDVREITFDDGAQRFTSGVGSGVILSADGLIMTNAHVVSPRSVEIRITLASLEQVPARLVGWDHWTDLALLQLDLEDVRRRQLQFTHARFGESRRLHPGQTVYAVGTPHGLARTVTRGIVSNTTRYFENRSGVRGFETGSFHTWLQTDAAINPGNSGGPLATEDGLVVGINTLTYIGADNLGFAVPSETAREVLESLRREGRVVRSYIGLVPGPLQDLEAFYNLEINRGLLVQSVDPGSPAQRAGLRAGDVVLALDDQPVDGRFPEQIPSLQHHISRRPVGSEIILTVLRAGSQLRMTMVTELLESRVGEEWAFTKWGLSVREVSRAYARENRLAHSGGVLVLGTLPAYPAEKAGLSRGDIITRVNERSIHSLADLKEIYEGFELAPGSLLLETLRNRAVTLNVLQP